MVVEDGLLAKDELVGRVGGAQLESDEAESGDQATSVDTVSGTAQAK